MHLDDPPKLGLIQPRDHKAKVVLWADLSVSDLDVINEAVSPDQVRRELAEIFQLDTAEDDMKSAILLDLYYYCIHFCRQHDFSKEQTSAFFSIVKKTHEVCTETPFGNVQQCFRYFKELLLCHAVKRPPYSIDLFNADQVRYITDYVINTYFRHFKMYKYAFTPLVRLDLSMTYVGLPETPVPSEAGDVGEDGEQQQQDGEEAAGETVEGETGEREDGEGGEGEAGTARTQEEGSEQTACVEDGQQTDQSAAAASELRSLIKTHLTQELQKLKADINSQMKEAEDNMNQKLVTVEGSGPNKSGSKHSAKSRRK